MTDFSTTTTTTTTTVTTTSACCCPSETRPTTGKTADGSVRFENENYRITVGDNNEVVVYNKQTGENYRIWGDPHVEIDGQHAFDFWGQTTFVLDDGTKVTIATTPWEGGDNGATVASEVTITDGDYTAHITGVDTNTRGDLSFVEYETGGALVDLAVDDGNVLYENDNGSGFVAVGSDGEIVSVDQAYINGTDQLKNPDAGSDIQINILMNSYTTTLCQCSFIVSIEVNGTYVVTVVRTQINASADGSDDDASEASTSTTTTTVVTSTSSDADDAESVNVNVSVNLTLGRA